jgi:hypothetical protein
MSDPQPFLMPFGKHKGESLSVIPGSYLDWLLRACKLSAGFRFAVAAELEARGMTPPAPPPPRPIPPCQRCGSRERRCCWFEDSLGRKGIRAVCTRCGGLVDRPPVAEPYISEANANASATPVLDALVRLEELGVGLVSDGNQVCYAGEGWRVMRAHPDLDAVVRQCGHELARLLGPTRGGAR